MTTNNDGNRTFLPTYCGGNCFPPLSPDTTAMKRFEIYPILELRLISLENIKNLWHNATPETREELHRWMQDCINGLRRVNDRLWETVVQSYLQATSKDEDSITAMNFILELKLDALNDHMHSQKVYTMIAMKFQIWSQSNPLFKDPHLIPYSKITRFKKYILEEFEGFSGSMGSQDTLNHALGHTYHHWERAEESLKLMVIYARTERELLPKFHELVANAVIKFKEHVMPGSNLGYDPLQEAARLGKLEYAAQTLRQAIEHPE